MQGIATVFEEDYLAFTIGGILSSGISGDEMDPQEFPMKSWGELSAFVKRQTIRNIEDWLFNTRRRRNFRWEIGEFWWTLTSFFRRKSMSKALDDIYKEWEEFFT
jgi:hypothetical protein